MQELQAQDPRPWGWRPVVVPCVALVILIVGGNVATRLIRPHTANGRLVLAIVGNVAVQGLLGLAIWVAGRDIAARYGGWGRTFGWRRPVWADLKYAAAGVGIALAARVAVIIDADLLTHGRAVQEAQNVRLHSTSVAVVALLVFVTVLCAPPIEEVMFRGLLLRTFMRRMGFWPAALLSTLIFGGFHTYEVNTLVGAVTLALVVGAIGLTNCVLVRLTDRLTPGIFVHATLNGLAAAVLIAQTSR
jgi:membrane protease YdiL (CAAX protease family)